MKRGNAVRPNGRWFPGGFDSALLCRIIPLMRLWPQSCVQASQWEGLSVRPSIRMSASNSEKPPKTDASYCPSRLVQLSTNPLHCMDASKNTLTGDTSRISMISFRFASPRSLSSYEHLSISFRRNLEQVSNLFRYALNSKTNFIQCWCLSHLIWFNIYLYQIFFLRQYIIEWIMSVF